MKDNNAIQNHMLRKLIVDIFDFMFSEIDFNQHFWSLITEWIWQESSTY